MWPTESPGETSILIIMWLQIKPCFLAAPVTALTYVGSATLLKTLLTLFPYGSSGNHDFKVDDGSVPELYPLSSIFLIHSSKRYRLGQPFSTGPVWNKAGSLCFDCLLQDDTESSGQCSKLQVARVCLLVATPKHRQARPSLPCWSFILTLQIDE